MLRPLSSPPTILEIDCRGTVRDIGSDLSPLCLKSKELFDCCNCQSPRKIFQCILTTFQIAVFKNLLETFWSDLSPEQLFCNIIKATRSKYFATALHSLAFCVEISRFFCKHAEFVWCPVPQRPDVTTCFSITAGDNSFPLTIVLMGTSVLNMATERIICGGFVLRSLV